MRILVGRLTQISWTCPKCKSDWVEDDCNADRLECEKCKSVFERDWDWNEEEYIEQE